MSNPHETIAEFKHRIALLMRNREGGKVYSVIGASPADPCVVRNSEINVADAKQHGILQHAED
jgi:hypothetical protein